MLSKQAKATKKMTDDSCRYAKGAVRYPGRLYHQQPNFSRFQKENSHLQEVFKKASHKAGKCVQKPAINSCIIPSNFSAEEVLKELVCH